MKVDIETITLITALRLAINSTPLEDIEFFWNDEKVEIPENRIKDFELTGLNNVDFITSKSYKGTTKD